MKIEDYKITSVNITNFGLDPISYGADIILNDEFILCFSPCLKLFFTAKIEPRTKKQQKFYDYFDKVKNFIKLMEYLKTDTIPFPRNELIFHFRKQGIKCKIL